MSIDIYIATPTEFHITDLNMANANAEELFQWLGLCVGLWNGDQVPASKLVPICRRRLWDEERNHDPGLPSREEGGPGTGQCRTIFCGRPPDYLRERTKQLLEVCEKALELHPESKIYWG